MKNPDSIDNHIPVLTFWSNRLDESKLGCYVYGIGDPRPNNLYRIGDPRRNNRLFYIGKGGGKKGKGNNRPDAHLAQAFKIRKGGALVDRKKRKISLINEIWDSRMSPTLCVIRRNLTEDAAFDVEAAIIETLGVLYREDLTNDQRGHNVVERGIITEESFGIIFAEPVAPVREIKSVFVFNIGKMLDERVSAYEAVRGDWKICKSKCIIPAYAVGLVNGISRVVVEIDSWQPGIHNPKRKSFQGQVLNDESQVGSELIGKDFSRLMKNPKTGKTLGYFQHGGVICVNFLGGKKAAFTRGSLGAGVINL